MSALSEILNRVRRLGVPGAPHVAAAPVDRVAVAESELAPVFLAVGPYTREAEALEEEAAAQADARRQAAAERAEQVLAEAHRQAARVRADAATGRLAELDREVREVLAGARLEAQRIDRAAAEQVPALVDEVVRGALAVLAGGVAGRVDGA